MTPLHWDQLARKDVTASFKEEKSVLLKNTFILLILKVQRRIFPFYRWAQSQFYDETFVKKELCTHQTIVFLQPCRAYKTPSICVSALVPLTCSSSISFLSHFIHFCLHPIPFATFFPIFCSVQIFFLFLIHVATAVSSCLLFDSLH